MNLPQIGTVGGLAMKGRSENSSYLIDEQTVEPCHSVLLALNLPANTEECLVHTQHSRAMESSFGLTGKDYGYYIRSFCREVDEIKNQDQDIYSWPTVEECVACFDLIILPFHMLRAILFSSLNT